jgi:uncharacterized protein YneF (UPF0154 family)
LSYGVALGTYLNNKIFEKNMKIGN